MSNWRLRTPVAFLVFNRPDTTEQVFARIAEAKPPKLLVVADGPRSDHLGEADKCLAARAIIDRVDWECEVMTEYSEVNLGCRSRVSSGLDWVFRTVEQAIILEDDCLPHPTFFRFCEDLLHHYRTDERVMHISGDNFQYGRQRTRHSYYFSRYTHIWGWATWRRAWKHYDVAIRQWPTVRDEDWLREVLSDAEARRYWTEVFQFLYAYEGKEVGWDFQWTLACWLQNGLSILPNVNLVSNIGFRPDATHGGPGSSLANIPAEPMTFPLHHPPFVVRDVEADQFTESCQFSGARKRLDGALVDSICPDHPTNEPRGEGRPHLSLDQVSEGHAVLEPGKRREDHSVRIGADDVDVKALVRQIREKIAQRGPEGRADQEAMVEIQEELWREQRENWTVSEEPECVPAPTLEECEVVPGEYAIDWRNPVLGPLNAQLRKIINTELRAYVRPVLEKQTHLNYKIKDLFREVHQLRRDLQKLSRELDEHVIVENGRQRKNDAEMASVRDGLLFGLTDLNELPEMDYFVFEEEHRGSETEILERQRAYLQYFKGCRNVVDLGCGRGEFLELLRSAGIGAVGVDLDGRMVRRCQSKGLKVHQADALTYLESLPDRTVDGIFAAQVVEHLRPGELVKLVEMAYGKLLEGGRLVLETVSPLSLFVFANVFFVDPSHVKPVHPNTLKFVLTSMGFTNLEVLFLAPVPEKDKLSQIVVPDESSDAVVQIAGVLNENVEKLNGLLFGNQDYAVVGLK